MAMNHFGDLTRKEINARNGFKKTHKNHQLGSKYEHYQPVGSNDGLPKSVDWRKEGYVIPVKNQGHCGSCWAFSTTGSVEGQYFNKTGTLVSLSEQQLVDCSRGLVNHGCNGGFMETAFYFIKENGIEKEEDYPYTAEDNKCQHGGMVVTNVTGYKRVEFGSEDDLQNAVATVGPVSVAIDVSHSSFHFYESGVYDEPACSSWVFGIDHAVLAVGYGTDPKYGKDYWLVKNSWGTRYGEGGYIKMSRNRNNQCGIATDASYPRL